MAFPTIPTGARVLTNFEADTTPTRTFPALSGLTKNSGDLLIAIIVAYQTSTGTDAAFSGWTEGFTEFHDSATSTTMAVGCAYKWSTGSETNAPAVTQAGTITGHAAMILLSIPGAHATSPPEAGGRASGTATAADPGSFNPSWGAEDILWIAVGGSGETGTGGAYDGISAAPANYGNLAQTGNSADAVGAVEGAVAFRQLNADSEDVGAFTTDISNARSAAVVIAVRPVPPAPTQTSTGEVGLGDPQTPETRTNHVIKTRARKTNAAHQGRLRVRLYEGSTPISAELESSDLTDSLAEYSFNVANADAEDITDYSNLSIRFYGYSANGTATVFEVAELWLEVPASGLTSVSQTLTPSYNVIAQITKTVTPSYNVAVTLQKALSPSYNVTVAVTKTVTPSYNVAVELQKALALSYGIAGTVQQSLSPSYNVQVSVVQTLSPSYSIGAGVQQSLAVSYGIAGIVTQAVTPSYNVIQQITQTLTPSYFVLVDVSKTVTPSYNIVQQITKALALSYNILGTKTTAHAVVSLAPCDNPTVRTDHWFHFRARKTNAGHTGEIRMRLLEGGTILTGVYGFGELTTSLADYTGEIAEAQADDIVDYDNLEIEFWGFSDTGDPTVFEVAEVWLEVPAGLASVTKTLTPSYQILLASVQKDLTVSYGIGGSLQKALTVTAAVHKYGPRGLHNLLVTEDATAAVQQTLTVSYGIAGSVQKTVTPNYNVQVIVTKTLSPSYNVQVIVSKSLSPSYNVAVVLTKALSPSYNVTTIVSKSVTPSYNVIAQLQKSLTPSYNIAVQLQKTLTPSYNILSTATVLKSLTVSFNIVVQLQKSLTPSYNVTTLVTKALSPSYNVNVIVSKALSPSYNIQSLSAVSKSLSVSYTITTGVVKGLQPSYTIRAAVVQTAAPSYTVRAVISKTLSPSYNITGGQVQKTLTPTYNVIAQVSKPMTFIYALGFVVVKSLAPSYTVRQEAVKSLSPSYTVVGRITDTLTAEYLIQAIRTKDLVASYWIEDPLTPAPPYRPTGNLTLRTKPIAIDLRVNGNKPTGRLIRKP